MGLEIGQWRFGGSGCMSKLSPVVTYKATAMSTGGADDTSFQDVQIAPGGGQFIKGQDYYLKIMIPQDMNYAMSFDLELIQESTSSDEVFQFIKNVSIERGGSGENAYLVVLYEDPDGNTSVAIPEPYIAGAANTAGTIYYDETNERYYLGRGGTDYVLIDKYNDLSVIASWKQESSDYYGVFEIVFRPIDDGFSHVMLRMIRTAQDYNIQRLLESGDMEFGRKVDINKMVCELYSINDLVDQITSTSRLNRIGVWGRPGLIMIINGEEIRIGPSGYYEQDALPIDSLGVVVPDGTTNSYFYIDYEFDPDYVE